MLESEKITHIAFSDESYWNQGRFRSVGMVTMKLDALRPIENSLTKLLQDSGLSEFKWEKVRSARERLAAEKLYRYAVECAVCCKVRIDVLRWDIEDSRHKIASRDDTANLQRMYYHLFKNVLRKRWPDESIWQLCPDEHTGIDWNDVHGFLSKVSVEIEMHNNLFTGGKPQLLWKKEFGIAEIQPVSSVQQPLIQLADLFAGLCCFSSKHFKEFSEWQNHNSPQLTIFDEGEEENSNLSASQTQRFTVLKGFNALCKKMTMGVSLKTNQGLRTLNPTYPINFWWYQPQHEMDKAPQKVTTR